MDKRTQGPRCAVMMRNDSGDQGLVRCTQSDSLLPATVRLGDGSIVEVLICTLHVDMGLPVERITTEGGEPRPAPLESRADCGDPHPTDNPEPGK